MRLEVDHLEQGYGPRSVLEDVSFEAESGELLTVLGPNGCGKSTLIRTICGVLRPRSGSVRLNGEDVGGMDPRNLAKAFGYVPQTIVETGYSTVYDLVLIGRRPYVEWNYSHEDLEIAADAMITMNVNEYADRNVQELSGGQKQRAFIARALAQDPEFYIFDEPTSSFDLCNQLDTMRIMKRIVKDKGACVIVALHDLNLAIQFSDRVMVLNDGGIHSIGRPEDVINSRMIKEVYGVDADIVEDSHGLYVRPFETGGRVQDRARSSDFSSARDSASTKAFFSFFSCSSVAFQYPLSYASDMRERAERYAQTLLSIILSLTSSSSMYDLDMSSNTDDFKAPVVAERPSMFSNLLPISWAPLYLTSSSPSIHLGFNSLDLTPCSIDAESVRVRVTGPLQSAT